MDTVRRNTVRHHRIFHNSHCVDGCLLLCSEEVQDSLLSTLRFLLVYLGHDQAKYNLNQIVDIQNWK